MARFEFRLPDIGEGVHEGEIMAWHVAPGDVVAEDAPMVEVMTDKATVTIDVPRAGVIEALRYEVGAVAKVGEVIVVIETNGAHRSAPTPREGASPASARAPAAAATPSSAPSTAAPPRAEGPAASAVGDIKDGLPGASFFARWRPPAAGSVASSANAPPRGGAPGQAGASPPRAPERPPASALREERGSSSSPSPLGAAAPHFEPKPLATPATRKLARELGVDLRRVPPSAAGGRVTAADVRASLGGAPTASFETLPGAPAPRASEGPREERAPFRGMRRQIAERLTQSARTAVHYTFVEELDATRLLAVRDRLAPFAEQRGVTLTFLPFVVKAVVEALRRYPTLNSYLDEAAGELVTRRYYDIGVATSTDAGLMVPAVRDADRRSLLHIAREIERLAAACRAGKVAPADLGGTTFTITSLGKQGGLFATPVLNYPEVGILGVHRIKKKPVVRDGAIVVGDVALLSFSFDHRVVDGEVGARFAYAVIDVLENPEALFLDMV